jgi:cob(I)alamin adenosyltransferase
MKKYFTSKGDQGQTDQLGKTRISKSHIRIRCLGAIDESSAALGLARAQADDPELHQVVKEIQADLYQIMSLVALEEPNPKSFPDLKEDRLNWLENKTEEYGAKTDTPRGFILPGENLPSASFGLARTITRRAERNLVELKEQDLLYSDTALAYLNRLSSFCFVIELYTAQKSSLAKDH